MHPDSGISPDTRGTLAASKTKGSWLDTSLCQQVNQKCLVGLSRRLATFGLLGQWASSLPATGDAMGADQTLLDVLRPFTAHRSRR